MAQSGLKPHPTACVSNVLVNGVKQAVNIYIFMEINIVIWRMMIYLCHLSNNCNLFCNYSLNYSVFQPHSQYMNHYSGMD